MAQSARYSNNPLNINPFWGKASAEPPLEWSKRAAIFELAVFAKDGIEVGNFQRNMSSPQNRYKRSKSMEKQKLKRKIERFATRK